MNFFFFLALICGLGTLATLFLGVSTLGKSGSEMKAKSNKYMQIRVGLQAATLVFLLLAVASA